MRKLPDRIGTPQFHQLPTVDKDDNTYRLPSGWEVKLSQKRRGWNRPNDGFYYENINTGSRSHTRPTRGSYNEKKWTASEYVQKALRAAMEKTRAWPEIRKSNHPTFQHPQDHGPASFPREIPRPRISPTLGSLKWRPSFESFYEYTNQSGFTPPGSLSPKSPVSPVSLARIAPFELYRTHHLMGFTLAELYDLGGIDPYDAGVGENTRKPISRRKISQSG